MQLEDFKKLYTLLSDYKLNFIAERASIEIVCESSDARDKLQNVLTGEFGITSNKFPENHLRLTLDDTTYFFYWDWDEFKVQSFSKNPDSFQNRFNKNIIIWNFPTADGTDTVPIFYDVNNQKTYADFIKTTDCWLFENSFYYLKFLHFLKSQENNEDGKYHFVDYFSWDKRQIILVSAKKEGKMTILFPNEIIHFDVDVRLKPRFDNFFSAFENPDANNVLPKFVKAELFNTLTKIPKENRMIAWVQSMDELLDIAHQNFDVFLSDLSVENIRGQYLDAKDKYFDQVRNVLSKLTTQIIALPISLSAVGLASYTIPNVKSDDSILYILTLAFCAYTLFTLFLLKLQTDDIADAREQSEYDFEKIDKSDFFIKFPNQKDYFIKIRSQVFTKLNTMLIALFAYTAVLIITNGFLIWRLLNQISFYPIVSIFFIEILFIVFVLAGNWKSIFPTKIK